MFYFFLTKKKLVKQEQSLPHDNYPQGYQLLVFLESNSLKALDSSIALDSFPNPD
ncbi:hypothetical protein OIU74_014102 [Salix koriyanagi]|uniref:Uncharacterized protein n=1 Tax=Salix koriyanagi TaxID=2511006 RepID=A0A9Q0PUY6_9ROSI|nr:hypothetical protein OIU74_014102 [Salix koriyanagi]